MVKVYITAHRGMGVSAKRRDKFIEGAEFFPENSIAAFKEAIRLDADALECDIHVSSDDIAMVIHGSKLTDYSHYIGTNETETSEIGASASTAKMERCKGNFESDEDKTCELFTKDEIQKSFALKKLEVNPRALDWKENGLAQALDACTNGLGNEPDSYQIPTLWQLLDLVAEESAKRSLNSVPPLKLNIELKGKNSGFITLATLHDFNNKQAAQERYVINYSDIILLGKMEMGEIRIAKNILKEALVFLNDTGIYDATASASPATDNDERAKLAQLFGEKEHEDYISRKGWPLYLSLNPAPTEKNLPNSKDFPDKAIILTQQSEIFYVKNGKFFRQGSAAPKSFLVKLDEIATQIIRAMFAKVTADQPFLEMKNIPDFDVNELLQIIKEQTNGVPRTFCDVPLDYQHGKIAETIAAYQYKKVLKKRLGNFGIVSDNNRASEIAQYIMERGDTSYELCLDSAQYGQNGKIKSIVDNYETLKSESAALKKGSMEEWKKKEELKKLPKEEVGQKSVEKEKSKKIQKPKNIIAMEKANLLKKFLESINWLNLKEIKTNIMLSTGELYGDDALYGNEDFDLRPGIEIISAGGRRLIANCFRQKYDGIDVSLFDFDEQMLEEININRHEIEDESRMVLGVTASNWKGSKQERSPISPQNALVRAQSVAQRLDINLLLKVDEPGIFKQLQSRIPNIIIEEQVDILESSSVHTMDTDEESTIHETSATDLVEEQEIILESDVGESPQVLALLENMGIDTSLQALGNEALKPTVKPPRGGLKKPVQHETANVSQFGIPLQFSGAKASTATREETKKKKFTIDNSKCILQ